MRYAGLAVLVLTLTTPLVDGDEKSADPKPKPDPVATKLLADARAARALWKEFPGFRADIEVNLDGKVSKGKVVVDADGKAKYEGLSKDAETWAKPVFGSIIGHRLDGAPRDTPCAFADGETTHPQGRLIRVLNDELHSGYRIRDEQILLVDRSVEGRKFTISVLENRKNEEGKYLPVSFVVNYWDPATGELVRSDASYQSWVRVGKFDLPVVARIVTAEKVADEKQRAAGWKKAPATRGLTLSNHQLLTLK
jgi:hypothetical protein